MLKDFGNYAIPYHIVPVGSIDGTSMSLEVLSNEASNLQSLQDLQDLKWILKGENSNMKSNKSIDKIVLDLNLGRKMATDTVPRVGLYPSQKISIYEKGFLIIQPRFLRLDKVIAHRYEDIISIKIGIGSSVTFVLGTSVSSSYSLRYRYFTGNEKGPTYGIYDRQEEFSSGSRKLMKRVRTNIESRLWGKIISDIQDGKEFAFGQFVVHKDYLRIDDRKEKIPISRLRKSSYTLVKMMHFSSNSNQN